MSSQQSLKVLGGVTLRMPGTDTFATLQAADTFAIALQAAAHELGVDADYETISAVAGNSFSPRINPREDCTAWWSADGRDEGVETVARLLGLRVRKLDAPWARSGDEDKMRKARKARAPILREAMENGEILLTTRGWTSTEDGKFVPWLWFGIVVEIRDDGTVLGACPNGRRDNVALPWGDVWAVSEGEATLTQHAADIETLRNAADQIRGKGERYVSQEGAVFGLAAMDLWIRAMEKTPFCVSCYERAPDRVWSCAHSSAEPCVSGAKVAASYLRKRMEAFNPDAQPHLEAAAKRYDRIVALLLPALTGEGGENYKAFIGDLAKQKAHADVLRQVKAELEGVADELEEAIRAETRTLLIAK